jgi:hypothetical protein
MVKINKEMFLGRSFWMFKNLSWKIKSAPMTVLYLYV